MTIENGTLGASLPTDLRMLVDESCLLHLALESVANAGSTNLKPFNGLPGQVPLSAPMMLTLISYSYAVGIFGSRDIECAIYEDQTLRYICAGQRPAWHDIRRFRRMHRDLVQKVLRSVLTQFCLQYIFPFYPELAGNLPPDEFEKQ